MRRICLTVLTSVAVVAAGASAPAQASFPGANGRIAFYVFNRNPQSIWTMAADGSDQVRLLPDPRSQYEPEWSADGARIVFARYGRRRDAIVSVAADGSDLQVVGTDRTLPRNFGQPTWAPSGDRIAFCAQGHDHLLKVFVIGTDGSDLQNVSGPNDDCYPAWSPDGSRIAVVSDVLSGAPSDIVTMDPDGANRAVAIDAGDNGWPDWSPDGSRLAFVRGTPGGSDLFVADADGGNEVQVTSSPGVEYTPAWAPDSTAIAYCRARSGDIDSPCDVFTIGPDGTGIVRLTDTRRRDEFNVSWQPLTG